MTLWISWKAQGTKAKSDKWIYINLKSFCTTKEAINGVKRQPMEWKKISSNHISDRGYDPKYVRNS